MDLDQFGHTAPGALVPIHGSTPDGQSWSHRAFVPDPLADDSPVLTGETYRVVAEARAALAQLDAKADQVQNPRLLRRPTLRIEAQATSELEGTYEPLAAVLTAETDRGHPAMREVLNYELAAQAAFEMIERGQRLTVPALASLQETLVRGTPLHTQGSGQVRTSQVVVGRLGTASDEPVGSARFVPSPPGQQLEADLRELLAWIQKDHTGRIDPLVAAGLAHYQFETLHPFHDGNGRIGRLLIVLSLLVSGVLREPTLTFSRWFERRRQDYYDRLLAVSTSGDWDLWIRFFAQGVGESARATTQQVAALLDVQKALRGIVSESALRAQKALDLVDLALAHIAFTVRDVERELQLSYGRSNKLVQDLVDLDVLAPYGEATYNRVFHAPAMLDALLADPNGRH